MKTTLIRLIAIMTLAGSMSAFASTGTAKTMATNNTGTTASENAKCPCPADEGSSGVEQPAQQNKKDREQQRLILEQDKQWEHDLHNITAG